MPKIQAVYAFGEFDELFRIKENPEDLVSISVNKQKVKDLIKQYGIKALKKRFDAWLTNKFADKPYKVSMKWGKKNPDEPLSWENLTYSVRVIGSDASFEMMNG